MVDFQSRDTRRGPTTDDEDDEETESADEEQATAADEEQPAAQDRDADGEETTTEATTGPESDERADTAEAERTTSEPDGVHTDESDTASADDPVSSGDPLADPVSGDDAAAGAASDDPLDSPATGDDTTNVAASDDPLSDPIEAPDSGAETPDQSEEARGDTDTGSQPAEPARSVAVGVITVSTAEADVEDALVTAFESMGHTVPVRERLHGDYDTVQQVADRLVGRSDVEVVVTAGGVGIGPDEVTIEAVHPLLEKALPGFGEAFRSLLFDVIGTGIVAVRTTAGVADGTLVFCLPGDAEAARLAVEEILATEAPELVEYLDD